MRWVVAVLALLALEIAAGQEVYRCEDPDGTVRFQDLPCEGEMVRDPAPAALDETAPAGAVVEDPEGYRLEHGVDARVNCERALEAQALHDFRWRTSGILVSRWPRIQVDESNGKILAAGDQVEFQNGFGNWIRHSYVCGYDPALGRVVDLVVEPGRL